MVSRAGEVRSEVAEVAGTQVSSEDVLTTSTILKGVVFESSVLCMQEITLMRFPVNDRSSARISREEELCALA